MRLGRSRLSVVVLEISSDDSTLREDLVDSGVDPGSGSVVSEVSEHESGGSDGGNRVGESESFDVGGGSVNAEEERKSVRRKEKEDETCEAKE